MPGPFNPNAVGSVVPLWAGGGGSGPSGDCQDCGNTAAIDLYISPTTGDDANPGTIGAPIATIAEAVQRLLVLSRVSVGFPVLWHLDHGPHVWEPIPPFLLGAALGVYADPAFDPTVRTTVTTGVAQAGTGQSVVVTGGGLVVDAHIKQWVTFTDGAAAGQLRSIRNNTVTDIVPMELFGAAPAAGDTYVVFTTNCTITAPAVNGPIYSPFAYGVPTTFSQYRGSGGIVLIGLGPIDPTPNSFWSFGQGIYEMYGCRFLDNDGFVTEDAHVSMGGFAGTRSLITQFFPGLGISFLGYGNVSFSVGFGGCVPLRATKIEGYASCDLAAFGTGVEEAVVALRASTLLVTGRNVQVTGSSAAHPSHLTYVAGTKPQVRVDSSGGYQAGSCSLANLLITDSDAGPTIRVTDSAELVLQASVTGQNSGAGQSLLCQYGSRVRVLGAPVYGRAAPDTDWDIEDGAPFDKSFFGVIGTRKFYLGNLILRES